MKTWIQKIRCWFGGTHVNTQTDVSPWQIVQTDTIVARLVHIRCLDCGDEREYIDTRRKETPDHD